MKISLPPAKWHKHVKRIQNSGTTGHEWLGDPGSSGFLPSEASIEVDPGDLIVSYDIGRKQTGKGACILWMSAPVRNSLIFLDEANSDSSWSIKFINRTRTLLAMPANARVIYGLDKRLDELFRATDRNASAASAITEATQTRAAYALRLGIPQQDPIDEAWIKAAFESFLTEQSRYASVSRERLLKYLQDSYPQLAGAVAAPSPIRQRAPRHAPVGGRRPLQLRAQQEIDDD